MQILVTTIDESVIYDECTVFYFIDSYFIPIFIRVHILMSQAQIDTLAQLFDTAVQTLKDQGVLPADWQNNSQITRTKDKDLGDFASNISQINPLQLLTY